MKASLYQVLGVPPNAKTRQIRAAIRRLMVTATCLPFISEEESANLANLSSPDLPSDVLCLSHHAAFILLDQKRRAQYDQCLAKNLHRQNLNQNRYKTLIQYTGGAIRKAPNYAGMGVRVYWGSEHIGVLPIGFGMQTDLYFKRISSISFKILIVGLILFLGFLLFQVVAKPFLALGAEARVSFLMLFVKAVLIFILPTIAIVWATRKFLYARYRVPHYQSGMIDASIVNMLELCDGWRASDKIFLGEDMPIEDSSWIFKVKMSHLMRVDYMSSARRLPWKRGFAFLIDLSIWWIILFFLSKVVVVNKLIFAGSPMLSSIGAIAMLVFSWLFLEALCLSVINTTLGRVLAGVSHHFMVTHLLAESIGKNSIKTNFNLVCKRAFFIWLYGLGMAIWPVMVCCAGHALYVMQHKDETFWNAAADGIAMTHRVTFLYTFLGILLVISAFSMWVSFFFIA